MIKAGNEYEENAIRFFMDAYDVNPNGYTVVIVRKSGMSQTDGLTVPKDKKQYVIFLAPSIGGAELIRLIAHEVAHVCQIIKGDLEFANDGGKIKVFWHDEEVNVDKVPYRQRPWEIEAYTLEKRHVHDFIKKYGNQMTEEIDYLGFPKIDYTFNTSLQDGIYDAIQSGYTITINGMKHQTKCGIRGTSKTKAVISNGIGNLIDYMPVDIQERLVHQDGEWVLLAKSSDRVLKKFGKTKPSEEAVKKEEARIQAFKHMKEGSQMKTFEELMEGPRDRSQMAAMLMNETDTVKKLFKPYEKYGKVVIEAPKDDGDDFFNVIVHLTYPLSTKIINEINKAIQSKLSFTDGGGNAGCCDVGCLRGNAVLDFFVDIPE